METIIYNGQKYNRHPNSKRKHLRDYYWKHDKWKEAPVALHRQIWIDNFGAIPKGFVIHHKDHNTLNNAIENLEMSSATKHATYHIKERRVEKITSCEYIHCGKEFNYFSIRVAKFCSYLCYNRQRHGTKPENFIKKS